MEKISVGEIDLDEIEDDDLEIIIEDAISVRCSVPIPPVTEALSPFCW